MLLLNNGSTEDVVQPPVVQIQSRNQNPEPNVAPVIPPVPKASIPFPSRRNDERRKEKANDQIEKFYEIFRDLTVILNKLPKKLGDPGRFLIPCEFTGITTCNALADLGASINLMPYSVWKSLSLPELTPTCMTLELADRSITEPIGIAEDIFVNVGKFLFPLTSVVVDFEPDPVVPFLFSGDISFLALEVIHTSSEVDPTYPGSLGALGKSTNSVKLKPLKLPLMNLPRELKNLAADIFSRLENPHQDKFENKEINEAFPLETLGYIALKDDSTPWFADFANYHAGKFVTRE
ncbi:reverse transcriptase domain-containing protein [Tanacetum coccineum]